MRARLALGLADEPALFIVAAGKQRRFRARQALPFGKINETLEIDLLNIDIACETNKIGQLRDCLLQPGQP